MGGLREIAPGVHQLAVSIANVYLVDGPGGTWRLIDTGVPDKGGEIRAAAESHYGRGTRPAAIVLTHGHFDHSGSARELAEFWDVPIYAHQLEMPFITGQSAYPPFDPTAGGFMAFVTRFLSPRDAFNLGGHLRGFGPGVDVLPGWEWFHTPGHSPGHVAYFRREDATLLAGDAFTTMNLDSLPAILQKKQQVCRPPTPINYDWQKARESVRLLSSLKPVTLACGHGIPMQGENATHQLAMLARDFPIPRHGRYVRESALTNEHGIICLPPKPSDPLPKIAAGIGVAALAGTAAFFVTRKLRN
ncbi:MAG TPA: MBL fold metallo-hydrolase [Bryobacteraceae bacterium]|nr:MBL fold metallo-hydrolase [Bryobacteraceae bacterium]